LLALLFDFFEGRVTRHGGSLASTTDDGGSQPSTHFMRIRVIFLPELTAEARFFMQENEKVKSHEDGGRIQGQGIRRVR
jgi:hypothetical protein